MAPATLGGGQTQGVSWPQLDLDDPAQRIFGDYELVEEISRGGMGVVYRARQRSLDREVAVKFVAAGIDDAASVARFLAEARAAARLVHPNIVPVHEVGSVDGLYYFSMPLIRGRTLADMLASGKLAPAAAVPLLLSLCDAIDYAHRLGLLHLDLKPANVMLDERDQPQVADFGLARHMDERGGVDAQEVSGTPSFMAPEQILIRQYRLTAATDIYALGAILYRCLAGVSPHGDGRPDDVIRRAAAGRIPPPRELDASVPRDLDAICMKCLELQPSDRYASVAALADDLRRVRDAQPVSVRRAGALERAHRWFRREPRLAFATAAAVAALLAGAAATTWQWREASLQRDAAIAQRDLAEAARRSAAAERDRAEGASALGAWLYAQHSSTWEQDQEIATRTLQWLRDTLPGAEARQAAVLTAFVAALHKEKREAADNMGLPLIEVMGKSYRRRVADALATGHSPHRYLLAARLAWFDERDSDDASNFTGLLDRAIAAQPDDPEVWNTAATFCTGASEPKQCRHPEAIDHLVRLDPGNAYHWLLRVSALAGGRTTIARTSRDGASFAGTSLPGAGEAYRVLHEAASRRRFDDHVRATWRSYYDAILESRLPVPVLLTGPLGVLAPTEDPRRVVAMSEASEFPLSAWQSLVNLCNPAKGKLPPGAASDCRAVGETMARSEGSVLSRMIGTVLVRRLSRGTPLEREMIGIRRRYLYIREMTERLTPQQSLDYPTVDFMEDIANKGELEAWIDRLEYFGLPTQPPAGWEPADRNALLLPEERVAARPAESTATGLARR